MAPLLLRALVVLGMATSALGNQCNLEMDVGILVDESGSVGYSNFQDNKAFIARMIDEWDSGLRSGAIRMSTAKFSAPFGRDNPGYHLIHEFGESRDPQRLKQHIMAMPYLRGGTATGNAIQFMERNVMNQVRPGVQKLLIVFADGESNQGYPVAKAAHRLRLSGTTIVAVGVGQGINRAELLSVAGDPACFLEAESYQSLNMGFLFNLTVAVCDAVEEVAAGEVEEEKELDCGGEADVIFLVDESGSVTQPNFDKMIDFLVNFVDAMNVSIAKDQLRLGAMSYSSKSLIQTYFDLNTYTKNFKAMKDVFRSAPYREGRTATGEAMAHVLEKMMIPEKGKRASAKPMVVVMTDGNTNEGRLPGELAKAFEDKNIPVYAMAILNGITRTEINSICQNVSEQVILVNEWDDLTAELSEAVGAQLCKAVVEEAIEVQEVQAATGARLPDATGTATIVAGFRRRKQNMRGNAKTMKAKKNKSRPRIKKAKGRNRKKNVRPQSCDDTPKKPGRASNHGRRNRKMGRNRGGCKHQRGQRWSFDKQQNKCVSFKFNGCGGSENNFEDEDTCNATCISGGMLTLANVGMTTSANAIDKVEAAEKAAKAGGASTVDLDLKPRKNKKKGGRGGKGGSGSASSKSGKTKKNARGKKGKNKDRDNKGTQTDFDIISGGGGRKGKKSEKQNGPPEDEDDDADSNEVENSQDESGMDEEAIDDSKDEDDSTAASGDSADQEDSIDEDEANASSKSGSSKGSKGDKRGTKAGKSSRNKNKNGSKKDGTSTSGVADGTDEKAKDGKRGKKADRAGERDPSKKPKKEEEEQDDDPQGDKGGKAKKDKKKADRDGKGEEKKEKEKDKRPRDQGRKGNSNDGSTSGSTKFRLPSGFEAAPYGLARPGLLCDEVAGFCCKAQNPTPPPKEIELDAQMVAESINAEIGVGAPLSTFCRGFGIKRKAGQIIRQRDSLAVAISVQPRLAQAQFSRLEDWAEACAERPLTFGSEIIENGLLHVPSMMKGDSFAIDPNLRIGLSHEAQRRMPFKADGSMDATLVISVDPFHALSSHAQTFTAPCRLRRDPSINGPSPSISSSFDMIPTPSAVGDVVSVLRRSADGSMNVVRIRSTFGEIETRVSRDRGTELEVCAARAKAQLRKSSPGLKWSQCSLPRAEKLKGKMPEGEEEWFNWAKDHLTGVIPDTEATAAVTKFFHFFKKAEKLHKQPAFAGVLKGMACRYRILVKAWMEAELMKSNDEGIPGVQPGTADYEAICEQMSDRDELVMRGGEAGTLSPEMEELAAMVKIAGENVEECKTELPFFAWKRGEDGAIYQAPAMLDSDGKLRWRLVAQESCDACNRKGKGTLTVIP